MNSKLEKQHNGRKEYYRKYNVLKQNGYSPKEARTLLKEVKENKDKFMKGKKPKKNNSGRKPKKEVNIYENIHEDNLDNQDNENNLDNEDNENNLDNEDIELYGQAWYDDLWKGIKTGVNISSKVAPAVLPFIL